MCYFIKIIHFLFSEISSTTVQKNVGNHESEEEFSFG